MPGERSTTSAAHRRSTPAGPWTHSTAAASDGSPSGGGKAVTSTTSRGETPPDRAASAALPSRPKPQSATRSPWRSAKRMRDRLVGLGERVLQGGGEDGGDRLRAEPGHLGAGAECAPHRGIAPRLPVSEQAHRHPRLLDLTDAVERFVRAQAEQGSEALELVGLPERVAAHDRDNFVSIEERCQRQGYEAAFGAVAAPARRAPVTIQQEGAVAA